MKYTAKYKIKIIAAALLAASLLLSLFSCAYSDKIVPCEEIIEALTKAEINLPAGKIYSSSAKEGESDYIPPSLINSLFGEGGRIALLDGWLDYAFFMPSSSHPCEFVAILCDTPSTAKDTARLLCHRLNTIKKVKCSEDFAAYLDSAEVTICRNYVLLIISSDTATAKKSAMTLLK